MILERFESLQPSQAVHPHLLPSLFQWLDRDQWQAGPRQEVVDLWALPESFMATSQSLRVCVWVWQLLHGFISRLAGWKLWGLTATGRNDRSDQFHGQHSKMSLRQSFLLLNRVDDDTVLLSTNWWESMCRYIASTEALPMCTWVVDK